MLSRLGQAMATILVSGAVVSCTAGKIKTSDVKDIATIMGKGFQCFLVPSEYYKPGTVFRINEHKVPYIANKTLADKVPSSSKDAAFGVLEGKQHVNLDVLVTLLNLKAPAQDLASVNATVDRTRSVDAKLTGLKLEIADDGDIDEVVNWFSSYPNKRPKSRYYVVREAYLADSMGLKITKELKAELGGEATFDASVKANPKLTYDPRATYDLTAPFPTRLRVCMKPEELHFVKAGIGGSVYDTKPVDVRLDVRGNGGHDD